MDNILSTYIFQTVWIQNNKYVVEINEFMKSKSFGLIRNNVAGLQVCFNYFNLLSSVTRANLPVLNLWLNLLTYRNSAISGNYIQVHQKLYLQQTVVWLACQQFCCFFLLIGYSSLWRAANYYQFILLY